MVKFIGVQLEHTVQFAGNEASRSSRWTGSTPAYSKSRAARFLTHCVEL
jgi:hypothetical protein